MQTPALTEHARRLQSCFGYVFADEALLVRALTHRSASSDHNERLEFLGDAVIELLVTDWLFALFPEHTEGELTRLRAKIVRRESLAEYARETQLGDALYLGSGELKSGGRHRDSILADGFEALIGAIYLDGGFKVCRDCLIPILEPSLPRLLRASSTKDAKTQLQEWLQSQGLPLPEYDVVKTEGVDHEQHFTVHCIANGLTDPIAGVGSSRRRAEQDAAQRTLLSLGAISEDE